MGYTTDTNIRYYLSALGSEAGGIGTDVIGTYAVSLNIVYADTIIDLMLSKRYNTPFTTTPPAIQSISTTLTSWKSLRGVFTNEIPSALQFVQDDYEKAMSFLGSLQERTIDLPSGTVSGDVVQEKGAATLFYSSTSGYTPVFDVDSELNWRVDPDRIEDIGASRE